jgi:acyl-CoA hydrolase
MIASANFQSSFTVFPQDCNYNEPPCIFGGKMLAEMDNCAAMVCRRALYGTGCTDAVTVNVNVSFQRPAYIGDIVLLRGWLIETGNKSLVIQLQCDREEKGSGKIEMMAYGRFTFVARKEGVPSPHGLTMNKVDDD